jgi:hypothetical protein
MSTTTTNRRTQRQKQEGTVPQAKATQKTESAEDKAKREAEEQAQERWLALVERATAGDSPAARQIARAIKLEQQMNGDEGLRSKINDNRTYLRLMDRNEELDEDQAEFVDVFYAEKEKGERRTEEEAEATVRARKLARSNGQS